MEFSTSALNPKIIKKQNKKTNNKNNLELLTDDDNFILSLPEIIKALNNNNLLNIKSKAEISIIFEDFTWFGKVKNKLQNFITKTLDKDNLENSIAHYDTQSKSIHIFNGIVEPKTNNIEFKESYNHLINSVSNPNFIINFFVLHEIGHAIHDEIINQKKYNNGKFRT